MALDDMANVAQGGAGADLGQAQAQGLLGYLDQAAGEDRRIADKEHLAGVTVVAILDDSDVDVEDITFFQALVAGDAMTDLVVDRGADGAGKTPVIQGRRDGSLLLDDEVVTAAVEFLRGHARDHVVLDHFQNLGRQTPGKAHFRDLVRGLDGYAHAGAGDFRGW